jgi:hypothetical protein
MCKKSIISCKITDNQMIAIEDFISLSLMHQDCSMTYTKGIFKIEAYELKDEDIDETD